MFKVSRILVIAQTLGVCAVALSACGQKGPLVHPQDPLAADRATLLQTLTPQLTSPAQSPATSPKPSSPSTSSSPSTPSVKTP